MALTLYDLTAKKADSVCLHLLLFLRRGDLTRIICCDGKKATIA
jgi:hypothetical protein